MTPDALIRSALYFIASAFLIAFAIRQLMRSILLDEDATGLGPAHPQHAKTLAASNRALGYAALCALAALPALWLSGYALGAG